MTAATEFVDGWRDTTIHDINTWEFTREWRENGGDFTVFFRDRSRWHEFEIGACVLTAHPLFLPLYNNLLSRDIMIPFSTIIPLHGGRECNMAHPHEDKNGLPISFTSTAYYDRSKYTREQVALYAQELFKFLREK